MSGFDFLKDFVIIGVVVTCMCITFLLKNYMPNMASKHIILVIELLAVFLEAWSKGWIFDLGVLSTGLVSGLAGLYLYVLIFEREKEK